MLWGLYLFCGRPLICLSASHFFIVDLQLSKKVLYTVLIGDAVLNRSSRHLQTALDWLNLYVTSFIYIFIAQ